VNPQRILGLALVLLQAAALAYCFRAPLFSTMIVAVALVGCFSNFRFTSPDMAVRWAFALVVLYFLHRTIIPPSWYLSTSAVIFPASGLTAEYILVFQVTQFFVRRKNDRLPSYLPILAIVAVTCTGDFQATDRSRLVFQVFAILLIALTAGYFAACRTLTKEQRTRPLRGHRALLAIVLLTSGTLGWLAASNLYHYARDIESLLVDLANPNTPPDSAGFSGKGRLGSVAQQKANAGQSVALRVYADHSPGYLRGRAFETYTHSQWQTLDEWATLTPKPLAKPQEEHPPRLGDLRTFSLLSSAPNPQNHIEIWPTQPFQEVVFTPLGLATLQVPVDMLSINMHGIVQADEMPPRTAYVASAPEEMSQPLANMKTSDLLVASAIRHGRRDLSTQLDLLTALPDDLDPRIQALAERVAGQSTTVTERIDAVETYFHDNYDYQFGIDIPVGQDPLTYFLLEKPPAHCEFFASGAAVLLRAAGVPCRYVTGFVAAERNDLGNYWVARNRDAHAWVEAFDPARGWVLVEATPAGGVPLSASTPPASQVWDSLRAKWQRLVAAVRNGGIRAILGEATRWLTNPWALAALLVVAAGIALRWLRRRNRPKPALPRDPCLEQMLKLLATMDQRWQKTGLTRPPHETLHQFAERMTSATSDPARNHAAEWYRQFAAVRFSGQVNATSVHTLQEALDAAIAGNPDAQEMNFNNEL